VKGVRLAWFFAFFFVSGFCSLVYEVVWLRLAMAQFGVVTPLVSTVLSVFMAGLALGSWGAGRLVARAERPGARWPLRLYALAELVIGLSAFVVPGALRCGRSLLLGAGSGAAWGSLPYHLASGSWIALTLLPFCVCMVATFPLAMAAIRSMEAAASNRSFSYLYLANVLGATCGTLVSAFVLIELLGFTGTLRATAALNAAVAAAAFALAARRAGSHVAGSAITLQGATARGPAPARASAEPRRVLLALLFMTGFVSMAMEIVWVRQFTPYLGTVVYAFAVLLASYLGATFLGSVAYRVLARGGAKPDESVGLVYGFVAAAIFGLLPLVAADPRLPLPIIDPTIPQPFDLLLGAGRVALGLIPFCAAIGFITPMLVDHCSAGDPGKAGKAYAVNVVGCILGPLAASFGLLPAIGEHGSIAVLALLLFAVAPLAGRPRAAALAGAAALGLALVVVTRDHASLFPHREVRRDYEGTVVATDSTGRKELLVNGVGITGLTPITKMMVHLPLAFLGRPPQSALVLCFGMGTSFRSALSWGVPTTAVELVPSVPSLIGFYHEDGPELLRSPLARVVIDDGRRLLERSPDQYDVITIDPPPPVEAAGSGLLYSKQFYALARARLRPGGILQQWFPGGERAVLASVARAITESFPHVRVFQSVEGWGFHFLASDTPIPAASADVLAGRLPPSAARDLVEWWHEVTPEQALGRVVQHELPPERVLAVAPDTPALEDDRPINEYYLLRRTFGGRRRHAAPRFAAVPESISSGVAAPSRGPLEGPGDGR
jgi:spermidine synthase